MELKDMILSTLAELEEGEESTKTKEATPAAQEESEKEAPKPLIQEEKGPEEEPKEEVSKEGFDEEDSFRSVDDERHFCESMRERILVLFEGFQSPNNKSIEAKVDLTLNFLEYLLAVIDERLEILDKKSR